MIEVLETPICEGIDTSWVTKADTTQTDNDTTNIDIIVDTTLIPISFDVTIEDWEEVEP